MIVIPRWGFASAHDWFPDDGCRPGLSADAFFYAAGPSAFWGVYQGGWNNCHLATSTTTGPLVNWADWYLPVSSSYEHTYNIQPYIARGVTATREA